MCGEPAPGKGGDHKKSSSSRSQSKKSDRNSSDSLSPGSAGKRKSSSTENFKKKPLSGSGYSKALGPKISAKITKEIRTEKTKPARQKRHISQKTLEATSQPIEMLNLKRANLGADSPLKSSQAAFQKALHQNKPPLTLPELEFMFSGKLDIEYIK
jgi:hypothetical protein